MLNGSLSTSSISNDSIQKSNDNSNNYSKDHLNERNNFFGKIDGFFIENKGQINNDSVRFYSQNKGVWFLDNAVVFQIFDSNIKEIKFYKDDLNFRNKDYETKIQESKVRECIVLKLNFDGANKVFPKGQKILPHQSNFFYGNDSTKWHTKIVNYQEIIYENIYDNIDLKYFSTDKGLKYDFIIHRDGEVNDINLRYEGAEKLLIDSNNNIILKTQLGDFIDSNLLIYQNNGIGENIIKGNFKLKGLMTYGFNLISEYDSTRDLIIDPLIYSTFVGGSGYEYDWGFAIDSNANTYVSGPTGSNDFPNTTGVIKNKNVGGDIFVFKLNSNGSSLEYSTYIGGSNHENSKDIVIDSNNNIYITGATNSANFPVTINAFDSTYNGYEDVYVLKINSMGSLLIYSTFIGGSQNETGMGITIDTYGQAYITGLTESIEFPNTINEISILDYKEYDVFVLKLNLQGSSIIYSTVIGGSKADHGWEIIIDRIGNSYVSGTTESNNFPITKNSYDETFNGIIDAFIFKLNPNGSKLLYSTFLGGNDSDRGRGLAFDSNGNLCVCGTTYSSDFPITNGVYDNTYNGADDIFVLKLNQNGSSLLFSTFIGDDNRDNSPDIALGPNDNIFISGTAHSEDFPVTADADDILFNGSADAFVLELNPLGTKLLYSTFIGGSDIDASSNMALDSNNDVYITGLTYSKDFPISSNAFDKTQNGDQDIFVCKLNINSKWNNPSVMNFTLSESEIFRAETIYLYLNGFDKEDKESMLLPFFEYRDPNEHVWNKTYISTPLYNNSHWEVNFTPTKNAILGLYDFRVRFSDSDKLFSLWFYLNDTLLIMNNNNPLVLDFTLSKSEIFKTETIYLYSNGFDKEDEEQLLLPFFEYIDPDEQIWNTTFFSTPIYNKSQWKVNFTPSENAILGLYDFRVRFYDSDKLFSNWSYLYDALLVKNKNNSSNNGGVNPIDPTPSVTKNNQSQSLIFYSTIGLSIVIVIITSIFIAGTEIGKYGFLGAIIPLYSKKRKKKFDKNYGYKKGLVMGCILGNPGESYNSIKRVLQLNNGALAYYLKILERDGVIKSERDGMYKRFYPAMIKFTEDIFELSDLQKDIYKMIKQNLGITQKEISSQLDIAQQTINYHIQLMKNARIIRMEKEGTKTKCYVIEEIS